MSPGSGSAVRTTCRRSSGASPSSRRYETERHQRIAGELQKIAERIEAFYVEY
jgi:hypothetical protein